MSEIDYEYMQDHCYCSTCSNPPCSFCTSANYCENCDVATMNSACPNCEKDLEKNK